MSNVPPYRNVTNPPYNLNDRLRVSLEERLYPQALELFNAILFSGISLPQEESKPGFMPSASYVRLVTTLLAHPYYTSQIRSHASPSTAPGDAHILLIRLITINGPINANLASAWKFEKDTRHSRKIRRDGSPIPSIELDDNISGELANEESLFSCADDLWAAVGWSFNCSVAYPKRWKYLKNVLDVLLLGFEHDLWQRHDENNGYDLSDSIISKMLPESKGSGGYRRVIRAIFARGTGNAKNEFKQIWPDELLKKRPRLKGKRGLDSVTANSEGESDSDDEGSGKRIEEANYENYGTQMQDIKPGISGAIKLWGGMEALVLRQRFLSLLSKIAYSGHFIPLEDLYREYKEIILSIDVSSFSLFTGTLLDADPCYRSSLNQIILEAIISTNSPKSNSDDDDLTQDNLIERYLPFPANKKNSIVDNAKVTMLLETLMRLLFREGLLKWTPELEIAVEKGIAVRKDRVTLGVLRGLKHNHDTVMAAWKAAEDKLLIMVKLLKT